MKRFTRSFLVLMVITTVLISACGGGIASPVAEEASLGSNKPLASFVKVQGYIEEINGNQWTINGQVVTIDASTLNDNELINYQVGDYVEVKAEVSTDGSLVVREVNDSSDDSKDNDDSNSNEDSNSNDDDSNDNDDDSNSNDDSNDNDDSNSNDDSNDNDDSNSNDDSNDNDDSNSNDDDDSNDNDDSSNSNDDDDNGNDD